MFLHLIKITTNVGEYIFRMGVGFPYNIREVACVLAIEIIPCSHLPKSLQSDNGPVFKVEVIQGLSGALGIDYHLHCA
jgi:hypothetical protein